MDTTMLYDTIYGLAAYDTKAELFGSCAPLAHACFVRSLANGIMPTVWFELPLLGAPRFDLHVAYGNRELHEVAPFATDAADGHGELLNWYAAEPRAGVGLALAFDVGDDNVSHPAIHANINNATSSFDVVGFFTHVGRDDATERYDDFVRRIPEGWRVWYFGVHPDRPGAPVRVDLYVDSDLKGAYAANPSLFEAHLRQVGVTSTSDELVRIGCEIARLPFNLELQFDVLDVCLLGPNVSLSAGFPIVRAELAQPALREGGNVARILAYAQELGLADDRWHHVTESLFTTRVVNGDQPLALYCVPVFVKLRTREGTPLDAKVYLQAGARTLP